MLVQACGDIFSAMRFLGSLRKLGSKGKTQLKAKALKFGRNVCHLI
jgi:hypothetical protein